MNVNILKNNCENCGRKYCCKNQDGFNEIHRTVLNLSEYELNCVSINVKLSCYLFEMIGRGVNDD